jgi:hypothetical protein
MVDTKGYVEKMAYLPKSCETNAPLMLPIFSPSPRGFSLESRTDKSHSE